MERRLVSASSAYSELPPSKYWMFSRTSPTTRSTVPQEVCRHLLAQPIRARRTGPRIDVGIFAPFSISSTPLRIRPSAPMVSAACIAVRSFADPRLTATATRHRSQRLAHRAMAAAGELLPEPIRLTLQVFFPAPRDLGSAPISRPWGAPTPRSQSAPHRTLDEAQRRSGHARKNALDVCIL
jgi:hypothetical protein